MGLHQVVEGNPLPVSRRGADQWFGDRYIRFFSQSAAEHPIAECSLRHSEVPGGFEEGVGRSISDVVGRARPVIHRRVGLAVLSEGASP